MVFVVYIFFFFFKQKTAYEMRISDWSSDVCSSDLLLPLRQRHVLDGGRLLDAGVIDQDVDTLEMVLRRAKQLFHVVFAADVGGCRDGGASGTREDRKSVV